MNANWKVCNVDKLRQLKQFRPEVLLKRLFQIVFHVLQRNVLHNGQKHTQRMLKRFSKK